MLEIITAYPYYSLMLFWFGFLFACVLGVMFSINAVNNEMSVVDDICNLTIKEKP